MTRIFVVIPLLVSLLHFSWAIDADCNYSQYAVVNQNYYIYSKNYPQNYTGTHTCRWLTQSAVNTRIRIYCEDVLLPVSTSCNGDRLLVSLSGDPNLADAHKYCGRGSFTLTSNSNSMSVALVVTKTGRFLCTQTVIPQATVPTQPPNCDCGWQNMRRIVGGTNSGINEYPSMSALVDATTRLIFCGAAIVNTKYAVTAAHCITNRSLSTTGLLVGDWDISTGSDTSAAKLYTIRRFVIHPSYTQVNYQNDIGIVETTNIITYSLEVGPCCLPFLYQSTNFVGAPVTALGWGTTSFSGPQSDILQKVNLTVISRTQCLQNYPQLINTQFCTLTPGKDACQADSGGPEYWRQSSATRLQLLGLISFGRACATSSPGINTDVRSYLNWIVAQTPDVTYCVKA